jgi:oligopeptide transport system substrate-binding protein
LIEESRAMLTLRWCDRVVYWGIVMMFSRPHSLSAAVVPPGVALAAVQQLVINNGAEVQSLDPHKTHGAPEMNVLYDLFEGLLNLDNQGQIVPGVALRWHASADLKVWTFYLRPEARWSNGDPVTAQDFVYSWRRLADPATRSANASYLSEMQLVNSEAVIRGEKTLEALGIQAIEPHTLQLSLSQPLSYLPSMLVDTTLYPLHQGTVERYGNGYDEDSWYSVSHFVGNGAYRLQSWVVNEKLVLDRSETYWDRAHTVIDRVTYLTIADEVVDIRRYQAGEIDITHYLFPTEHYLALQQQQPDELWCFPSLSVAGYRLNTQKAPFNDVRVRQALSLVLDREAIVKQFLVKKEQVAYTLNSERVAGFKVIPPEWASWPLKRRESIAKKLLRAAGYHRQKPLRFRLLYNMSEMHEQLALLVSNRWEKALDVEVTLEKQEWKVFLAHCLAGEYQAARFSWPASYNEPSSLLNILQSNSSDNSAFYRSSIFDQWLEQALQAPTAAERCRCYQQAERVLAEDVPVIPLYHGVRSRLVKPYVRGLDSRNPMNMIYTKDLYLIQHPQAPSRYRQ